MKIYLNKKTSTINVVNGIGMDAQRFNLKVSEEDFNKIDKTLNELNKYKFLVETFEADIQTQLKEIILKQKGD